MGFDRCNRSDGEDMADLKECPECGEPHGDALWLCRCCQDTEDEGATEEDDDEAVDRPERESSDCVVFDIIDDYMRATQLSSEGKISLAWVPIQHVLKSAELKGLAADAVFLSLLRLESMEMLLLR